MIKLQNPEAFAAVLRGGLPNNCGGGLALGRDELSEIGGYVAMLGDDWSAVERGEDDGFFVGALSRFHDYADRLYLDGFDGVGFAVVDALYEQVEAPQD